MKLIEMAFIFVLFLLLEVNNCFSIEIDHATNETNIYGGSYAVPRQFPHQVSLQFQVGQKTYHTCGGSIISENAVVTAAHCFGQFPIETYMQSLIVLAGTTDNTDRNHGSQQRKCLHIFQHPNYMIDLQAYKPYIVNDIAIIIVREPFQFNKYVNKISPIYNANDYYLGEDCIVSGWGNVYGERHEKFLKWARMKVASTAYKELTLERYPDKEYGIVCAGDSGGPLHFDNKLIGVASYVMGRRFCPADFAGFTNIFYYKNWINDIVDKYRNL